MTAPEMIIDVGLFAYLFGVICGLALAHIAYRQGEKAADRIMGRES